MSEQIEHKAKLYQSLGVFAQAKKFYQELYNITEDLDDRTFYKSRIRFLENLRQDHYSLSIGEAFFPVVDEATGIASIQKLKITNENKADESSDYLTNKWIDISKMLIEFLNGYLERRHPNIYVFDWRLESLTPEIDLNPRIIDKKNLLNSLRGNSIELALFMSGLSYLLNKKIDEKFVFSSAIQKDGSNIALKRVGGIKVKLDAVKNEFESSTTQIITAEDENTESSVLYKYEDIEPLVKNVFDNLDHTIQNHFTTDKFDCIRLEVPLYNVNGTNGKQYKLAQFNHKNIDISKFTWIADFFNNISKELTYIDDGVIIDGLKPNVLGPMLMTSLSNHCKSFIAFRYAMGGSREGRTEKRTAIITNVNRSKQQYRVGEVIEYTI